MYLSLLFITFLLVAPSHTFPVDIDSRQARVKKELIKCKVDNKQGPCICGDQFTIRFRASNIANRCAKAGNFQFTNPDLNVDDGTVEYVSFALNEFRRSQPL